MASKWNTTTTCHVEKKLKKRWTQERYKRRQQFSTPPRIRKKTQKLHVSRSHRGVPGTEQGAAEEMGRRSAAQNRSKKSGDLFNKHYAGTLQKRSKRIVTTLSRKPKAIGEDQGNKDDRWSRKKKTRQAGEKVLASIRRQREHGQLERPQIYIQQGTL